jgi:hypothetical protein
VFLGYPSTHKGYCCLDLATRRIIISRHVVFDEFSPFARESPVPDSSFDFLLDDDSEFCYCPTNPAVPPPAPAAPSSPIVDEHVPPLASSSPDGCGLVPPPGSSSTPSPAGGASAAAVQPAAASSAAAVQPPAGGASAAAVQPPAAPLSGHFSGQFYSRRLRAPPPVPPSPAPAPSPELQPPPPSPRPVMRLHTGTIQPVN